MDTRRTLSNISFNSPYFFRAVIADLFNDDKIDWCYWIVHQPDKDDKKVHIHFCFQPSRTINTKDFAKRFYQWEFKNIYDPGEGIFNWMPRKATDKYMTVTSLQDWLLYCKHDESYLSFKGLTRNIHYDWDDFEATDIDSLYHDISDIDMTKFGRIALMEQAIEEHRPFYKLVSEGKVPIQFRAQYEQQYLAMVKHIQLERDKNKPKENKIWGYTKDDQLSF